MLRDPSIKKHRIINMHTISYCNISEFAGIWKEGLMRKHKKQPDRIFTSLVGCHNYSSPLMF